MGISDKDYGESLTQKHIKAHVDYLKKLEEERMAGTILSSGTINANNITTTNTITGSWENRMSLGVKTLNEQDLQHDAMKAPLSALADMWTVRWGGEWVNESLFIEDDFWRLALIRLMGANKLEKHNLANQYTAVYRIIE